MVRNGLLEKRLPKPTSLARYDMAHCYAVVLDLVHERVLVIDSLKEKDSVYKFTNAGASPTFSMAALSDLLLHRRFIKHSSGTKYGWLRNCRMVHANYARDSECFKRALALCQTLVNTVGDFEKRWNEAGESCHFHLAISKAKR
jgi:hypothetical protein